MNQREAGGEAEVDDSAPGDEAEVDDSALVPLPKLDQTQIASASPGGGVGGGGGAAPESASIVTQSDSLAPAQDLAIDFIGVDIFEETQFVLNSDLPSEPARAQVQQQSVFSISIEEAQAYSRPIWI